jgi:phage tail sheath gpL-like
MAIEFQDIPSSARVPFVYVEFDASKATVGATTVKLQTLLVGQRLSTGTVQQLQVRRVTSIGQAANYFGHGSMLEAMAQAFLENNRDTDLWVIALDDPSGSSATATITIVGTATQAGALNLYIDGVLVQVSVAISDDETTIATAIVAAISADTGLPVTAGSLSGVVTLTARHLGVVGNEVDVRGNYRESDRYPNGVDVTIAPMAGGAGDIDVSQVWTAIGEEQYHVIVVPVVDGTNLDSIDQELADRWKPIRQNDGVAISAHSGDLATVTTFGATRNGPHLVVFSTFGSPTSTYEVAAAAGALVAKHGSIDPARPFQTLQLVGVLAPALRDRFKIAEREVLLRSGISTVVGSADGTVRLERPITTYRTNEFGADDPAYLDLTTILTLSFLRYDFRTYFLGRYPRHKLADDGVRFGPDQAIMTPGLARAEAIAKARDWESRGLIENVDLFKRELVVERNSQDPNRLDFLLPPNLINQLMVTAVKLQFRL